MPFRFPGTASARRSLDPETRTMLDQPPLPDLPDLPALPHAHPHPDSPLRRLHAAWVAAKATMEALPPGRDESLADATFALVMRLEREIAAYVPETAVDLALKVIVADFDPGDYQQASAVRFAHWVAGLEITDPAT
jgi:hypothetical protein